MDVAEARRLWLLEVDTRHLNHGGFGACPASLLDVQVAWRARMERQPSRFFMNDLGALLREAAAALARFIGAVPERVGFVDNATTAVNAVIAAAPLRPGDELLTTDHVYNAVRLTLRHHAARAGAEVIEAPIGMPLHGDEAIVEAVLSRIGPRTRLLVLDHVASPSAAIMPLAPIIAAARKAGIPVLVDGAHAPGLIDLDIGALGATWYAGNCHKWLCSPKGAGFLAAADDAPWEVRPTVISHAYGQGFAAEFDKTGTRDVSAWLTVPDAIALHERLGGAALRRRNAALAREAAGAIAGELSTELGAPPAMFAAMATIRLPVTAGVAADWPTAAALRNAIWDVARIEVPVTAPGGALWLRISAQAYNDAADYAGLAAAACAALSRLATA
jgi:isopenicillin-N epimerase